MFTDAQAVLAADVIDENHTNTYTFADDVTEVPDGTSYLFGEDGTTVAIYDTSIDIQKGGTFALYQNGIPQIYTALDVTADEEQDALVVTMEAVDAEAAQDAITAADAEGYVDADLSQVVPAEGVEITYIEGGTEEAAFADGIAYTSPIANHEVPIKAVKLKKTFNLGSGLKASVSATVSNAKLGYKDRGPFDVTVYLKGDLITSGTISGSSEDIVGKEFTLGSIPVAGIGKIELIAIASADGSITLTCTNGFDVGVEYTSENGFRVIPSFWKKSFRLEAKVNAQLAVKAHAEFNIIVMEGQVTAEAGAKAEFYHVEYGDSLKPFVCDDFFGWLYAEAFQLLIH